jgi:hypothetical protein
VELTPDNLSMLLHRFYNFDDAVVAHVDLALRPRPLSCTIDVHAGDRTTPGGWSAVRFVVHESNDFRFALGRTSFLVLSFGLQFIWKNGLIYVLLDAVPEGGTELPDLTNSKGYVAGKRCVWEVLGPVT